jgi:class 3 adenylate cyclase/tetratricopeptide (TPR) repeat protein
VPAANKFCGQCGTRLNVEQPATPQGFSRPVAPIDASTRPAAPHTRRAGSESLGTRREVTVLFLDLTNFTAASHNMDSEEVFIWIDETLRLLASVVHKYEGTIDKFTGDGLMALFGAPVAHENDPELAVRTALEMQTVVRPLRERILQKHGFDFQMRIGINAGPVIAGNVGDGAHMEYTVLGDTVNLASRLEKAAEPGTVLVSTTIYQRTQALFEYEILAPLSVKGVGEPLQTFRPLGLREQPGLVRGIAGLQAPMIGRDHLLAHLHGTLDAVRISGQHRVALITGEAGLGKSRLVAEFRKMVRQPDVRFYQGACLAYARSTPLWVIAAIVRDILRLSEIDPPTIQRETLRAYLSQSGIADYDMLPYLNNVLGLEQDDSSVDVRLSRMDASMLQRQTHAALRQLFLFEAERAPTVLVFDDLHWVDPASRDFLEYLTQTTGDAQLLLVLVSRDSERQTVVRPLIAVAEKAPDRFIDIQLQALSDAEGELLVDQLIRQNTAQALVIKQQVAQRAAGNPFYIEEIIRILIDHGGLTNENGVGHITPQAAELLHNVPETLKGLILTRFDRLPDFMRRTLQKAAVLGRSFPASLLQILEAASPVAISAQFAELEARQFLVAEPFGWVQGYAFRHVLIQEAVYGTLLKRDRQQLHEQVAQLIERAAFWPKDEQIEVLAYHYAESASPGKAVPYLIDAAENAARRYANETAIRHYRRAISLMPPDAAARNENFFRVRAGLGQALKFVGQFSEASLMLVEGLTPLQDQIGERGTRLRFYVTMLRELADVRQRERAYEPAVAHLETALQALGAAGEREEPALWRSVMDRMAWIRFRQSQLDDALALASAATRGARLECAEDPIALASLFNTIGGVHWQRGDFAAAINYVDRSLLLYKDLGYAWGMAISYINLGILHYTRGNWAKAASSFEQAYVLQRDNGYLPEQALNLHNLGALHIEMGDHEQARRDLETSRAISQRLGHDFSIVCAEIGLLKLAVIQSDFVAAEQHVETVQTLLAAAGSEETIQACWLTALVWAARGDLPQGLEYAQQALQMARAAGLSELESECLRVLGMVRARAGDLIVAEALFYKSIAVCRQRNDVYRHGLALLELGRLYEHLSVLGQSEQSVTQALEAYRDAAELFKRLGANYDLEQAQTTHDRLRRNSIAQKEEAIWHNREFLSCEYRPEIKRAVLMS